MKGHIRKRGKNAWAIVLDIGHDEAGKRRQRWHSVKGTKRDAERELAQLINELNTGAYVEASRLTVSAYLKDWIADAETRVAAKTAERYRDIIDGHISPALGNIQLAKLKPLHIQRFYAECLVSGRRKGSGGLSAQTVLHLHRVLRRALEQAVMWQLLMRNPADAVRPPRPERRQMTALDETQTAALLNSLRSSRHYAPVVLAVSTGMRRGEILALRWSDIDFGSNQLSVSRSLELTKNGLNFKTPKTAKSRRRIALPQVTARMLSAHKVSQAADKLRLGPAYHDNDLVFARRDGTPWRPDSFSSQFSALVRYHKLPHVRFHDLRHTHATQLLKQGVHPKIVSERLGHSNIAITLDTYSHVLPGMQESAIEALDASLAAAIEGDG